MTDITDLIAAVLTEHTPDPWGYCTTCTILVDADTQHLAERIEAAVHPYLRTARDHPITVQDWAAWQKTRR